MGFNFHLEKQSALRISHHSVSTEKHRETKSTRRSVHYELPVPQPSKGHQKRSLKSRAARFLRFLCGKVTGSETHPAAVRHSTATRSVRISNPIRSTVTSLALASFDDLRDFGHPKMAEESHLSIPVTMDGAIVDHIKLPASAAPRITGIAFSDDMRSLQLTTQTPPSYEQARAQPLHPPFKPCRLFDNGSLEFAASILSSAEPLVIWPAPTSPYSLGAERNASIGAIRRKVRIAPGNMIQLPSKHDTQETYMLASEISGIYPQSLSRSICPLNPRLFVATAQTGADPRERVASVCRAFILTETE